MAKQKKISASLENYLEAIYLISRDMEEVRSRKIREHLGVTGPSVTEALHILKGRGLVNYNPYAAISLTAKGESFARNVRHRHEALRDFFIEVLGIDSKTADEGACKMEYVASANIIDRMIKYTSYIKKECKGLGCDKADCFKDYLQEEGEEAKEQMIKVKENPVP